MHDQTVPASRLSGNPVANNPTRSNSIDFEAIKARVDYRRKVEELWEVKLKNGRCPCKFHGGEGLNFSVKDDGTVASCFSDGCFRGDVIEFVARVKGISRTEAAKDLDSHCGPNGKAPGKPKARPKDKPKGPDYKTFKAALDALKRWTWRGGEPFGEPAHVYRYPGLNGRIGAYVARFERTKNGKREKEIRPISLHPDGWRIADPPGLWHPYRLPTLLFPATEHVLVVEGEKCADLVAALGFVVTTSAHGATNPKMTDWSALAGKRVTIIIDHDETGRKYGEAVGEINVAQGCRVAILDLPGLADGEDVEQWRDRLRVEGQSDEAIAAELDRLIRDVPEWSPGGLLGFLGNPPQVRRIFCDLRPVPVLDDRLIPEPFRAWLTDISERVCCPVDLPAISAVVSIAAVIGNKITIRPKSKDDWTVAPNLWGMGVLPPGYLKTHCLEEPKSPLDRLEIEAREQHEKDLTRLWPSWLAGPGGH